MPGLPFGAAQQHEVSNEFKTYEGIEKIEFIEIDPNLPSPRSVAYRPSETGGEMIVRNWSPELHHLELDESEARHFIKRIAASGLFSWQRAYRPSQGTFVVSGHEWRLEVSFSRLPGSKRQRPFKVEGENVFPDDYKEVVALLMAPAENRIELSGDVQAAEE